MSKLELRHAGAFGAIARFEDIHLVNFRARIDALVGSLRMQAAYRELLESGDTLRWVFIAVALIGIAVAIHARIDDWKRGQR